MPRLMPAMLPCCCRRPAAAARSTPILSPTRALLPPRRLGLPDYALLQGAVGAGGSSFQQAQAAAAAGLHAMGGMRGSGTPPLDPAALSATQVNLAGFGLGGLGNGERTAWHALERRGGGGGGGRRQEVSPMLRLRAHAAAAAA